MRIRMHARGMGINWYVLFDSNAGWPPRNNRFNPRWERKISGILIQGDFLMKN